MKSREYALAGQTTRLREYVSIILFCILLVVCGAIMSPRVVEPEVVVPADAIGSFRAKVNHGDALLTIMPNGTFAETFMHKGGKVTKAHGTWTFVRPNTVYLHKALVVVIDSGPPESGVLQDDWILPIILERGRTRMDFNPDSGWFFEKFNNAIIQRR